MSADVRLVFIDNLLFEDAEGIRRYILQPHLGLISLIAVVEAAGHNGLLFDPKVEVSRGNLNLDRDLYRNIAERVLQMDPDAVGFTSLGCNFICTAKTAGYLKEARPGLPILLGGPHATVLDEVILRSFPQFDLIVRNEVEETILSVIEALGTRAFKNIPGVSFAEKGIVQSNPSAPLIADLDTLPIPAYHRYPVRELGLTSLRVDAGRGCPFQCTFCSTASFFGRQYRLKSAARLRDELDFLHRSYGISDFSLTHDLFTVNRKKVLEFCAAIEGRGYTWKCSARQDCVDDELLERMGAAGCRSIYYGIETGSERMQKISKKRLDLGLFDRVLDTTQKLQMSATVSFITGYPEETDVDQRATLDLIGHCFEKDDAPLNVQLHLLTPEPGTTLLHQYHEKIAYDGHISDFNFPTLEHDDGDVIKSNPGVFINHHYFPSVLPRDRHVFVTTSYQYLYGIGFPVLRYILRQFRGRLSDLIESMNVWRLQGNHPAACDRNMIASYFADTFGRTHHISGLVRYMLEAAELRRRAINDPPSPSVVDAGSDGDYVLSRRAAVVRRVPDCHRILQVLDNRKDACPRPTLLRQRYDFLLHLPRSGIDAIENLELSPASAAFFDYLSNAPGRIDDDSFESVTGYPLPPREFVHAMADRGILETRKNGEAQDQSAA